MAEAIIPEAVATIPEAVAIIPEAVAIIPEAVAVAVLITRADSATADHGRAPFPINLNVAHVWRRSLSNL
jgi:hypothetical protein